MSLAEYALLLSCVVGVGVLARQVRALRDDLARTKHELQSAIYVLGVHIGLDEHGDVDLAKMRECALAERRRLVLPKMDRH